MIKSIIANSLGAYFSSQKNNDILFSDDVGGLIKNRHYSHICFADNGEGGEGDEGGEGGDDNTGGDDDKTNTPPSALGGDNTGDDNADDENKDGDEGDDDDPDGKDKKDGDDEETGAPEKYEFSLPEGMELDAEALEAVEPIFREANLSNEMANKLASVHADLIEKQVTAAVQQAEQQLQEQAATISQGRYDAALKDEEFGGKNAAENFNIAKGAIHKLAGDKIDAVLDALRETGADNHPEIIRVFYRAGKAMQDDTVVHNGDEGGAKKDMYPNSPNLK